MKLRVVLAADFVLGVLGTAWWYFLGQSQPVPWNKPAALDGEIVRFTYSGSECRDGADVEVVEDSTRVVITVKETVRARSCSDVGVPYDIELRLDAPLAGRGMVDGACQMPKYARYIECGPNKATVEPGAD